MRLLTSLVLVLIVFFFAGQAVVKGGDCPVWTVAEISVIGTYGGDVKYDDDLIDNNTSTILKDEEKMSDRSWEVAAAVYEYKLATTPLYNGYYINTYIQPKVEYFRTLTTEEYRVCKSEIEGHVMP